MISQELRCLVQTTLGACSLGNDGSLAIPATIDNSLSTSDAEITIKVEGSTYETLVVGAESTTTISIAPVQSGESVEVLAADAMGVVATVTETTNASAHLQLKHMTVQITVV